MHPLFSNFGILQSFNNYTLAYKCQKSWILTNSSGLCGNRTLVLERTFSIPTQFTLEK